MQGSRKDIIDQMIKFLFLIGCQLTLIYKLSFIQLKFGIILDKPRTRNHSQPCPPAHFTYAHIYVLFLPCSSIKFLSICRQLLISMELIFVFSLIHSSTHIHSLQHLEADLFSGSTCFPPIAASLIASCISLLVFCNKNSCKWKLLQKERHGKLCLVPQ